MGTNLRLLLRATLGSVDISQRLDLSGGGFADCLFAFRGGQTIQHLIAMFFLFPIFLELSVVLAGTEPCRTEQRFAFKESMPRPMPMPRDTHFPTLLEARELRNQINM